MDRLTTRLDVRDKVFTKAHIQRIAAVLADEHASSREKEPPGRPGTLEYTINFEDGTARESNLANLFDDDGPLDLKRAQSISMLLYSYALDRRLSVDIRQGQYGSLSARVSGVDGNWVGGVSTRLSDIFGSVEPQDNLLLRHKHLFLHALALGMGCVAFPLLVFLVERDLIFTWDVSGGSGLRELTLQYPWVRYVIFWAFRWILGLSLGAPFVREKVLELWPAVEFAFGPEHHNRLQIRRRKLYLVVSMVAIPIAIELVADIVRSVIPKQ
jgi:hypothetical protein